MVTVADSTTTFGSSTRLHGLDALRAGALLLGIVLHSLLPFVTDLGWLVSDSQSSRWLGIPVFVIHLFRMVLFMMLAGYFGRLVLERRGAGRYFRDRVVRILLPFVVFWPVAVASLGYLAVLNAEVHNVPLASPPTPATPATHPLLAIPPGQLWFLLVLMECVVVALVVRALALRLVGAVRLGQVAAAVGRVLSAPGGVVLAALPYLGCLLLQGHVLGGINEPLTLVPSVSALTAYGGAFAVGWALRASDDGLGRIARSWPAHLGLALALTGLSLADPGADTTTPLLASASMMALAGWCWVYALLGLCVRFLTKDRPLVRYLADASYWMYLMHLPLLIGFEILLVALDWPIAVKLGATWLAVGGVLVVSYHLLVRSTPIGRWLNGRRYPFRLPG
ncbi:MAG: acyltransferase family protein [Propionibacteriaceae bacterium]